ncbi:MAG TPA: endonuclease domain-containing protein [Arsenicitalea sp.]|nr:endonuclease domain-containing protein [Arsenicitalea sp.]
MGDGRRRRAVPCGGGNGGAGGVSQTLEPQAKTGRARTLRKDGTDPQNRLWYFLRNRSLGGFKFARQVPVGPYFADFACREASLIVELDGGQHAESDRDRRRTAFLNSQGYSVLRFWNSEMFENRDGVLQSILATLEGNPSPDLRFAPATLSPTGRGTRGARAARAAGARNSSEARPIPLPVGERSPRQRGVRGLSTKSIGGAS